MQNPPCKWEPVVIKAKCQEPRLDMVSVSNGHELWPNCQHLKDTQTAPKKVHIATEEPHETVNVQPDEQTQFSVKDPPAAPQRMLDKG